MYLSKWTWTLQILELIKQDMNLKAFNSSNKKKKLFHERLQDTLWVWVNLFIGSQPADGLELYYL